MSDNKPVVEATDNPAPLSSSPLNSSPLNKEAADWLLKLYYQRGLQRSEQERFRSWVDGSPEHLQQLQEVAYLWGKSDLLDELGLPRCEPPSVPGTTSASSQFWLLRPAAVTAVAALLFIALLLVVQTMRVDFAGQRSVFTTQVGEQRLIDLADGSSVILNTDSLLTVNFSDGYRDIYLQRGEAHFVVASNRRSPFRVFAGGGGVRAIGTAFTVSLEQSGAVDVIVSEGVVSMAALQDEANVVSAKRVNIVANSLATLGAGQAATLLARPDNRSGNTGTNSPANRRIEYREVNQQELSKHRAWLGGTLLFHGEPLSDVVDEVVRYTGDRIEMADADIASLRVGGAFPIGDMQSFYEALETNFGLEVTSLSGGSVLLSRVER